MTLSTVLSYLAAIAFAGLQTLLMCLIGGYEKVAPLYMIILVLPIMFLGGGLEEAGWRYIIFFELNKKFGFVVSAAITGIISSLWHLTLFFIPGVNQYGKNFIVFTVVSIGLSFGLAAIRKVTGSVWLCVLHHMLVNAILEVFRYDLYGSCTASIITTVIMIIVSIVWVKISDKKKNGRIPTEDIVNE